MAYPPPIQPLQSIIPNDIARLATMYSLGPFFKAYRAQERPRAMLIGCPLLILGPPLLCGGLIALFMFSSAISEKMGMSNVPQLVVGGIALLVIGLFAHVAMRHAWTINASGTVVYLFQNGLIHGKGSQPTLLFWQQIASGQFFRAYRNSPARLVLKTFDRRTLTLHSIQDLSELTDRVQQALAYRLLPRQ